MVSFVLVWSFFSPFTFWRPLSCPLLNLHSPQSRHNPRFSVNQHYLLPTDSGHLILTDCYTSKKNTAVVSLSLCQALPAMLSKDGCAISIMDVPAQVACHNTPIFNSYFMRESMGAAVNRCPLLFPASNHPGCSVAAVQLAPCSSSSAAGLSLTHSLCLIHTRMGATPAGQQHFAWRWQEVSVHCYVLDRGVINVAFQPLCLLGTC